MGRAIYRASRRLAALGALAWGLVGGVQLLAQPPGPTSQLPRLFAPRSAARLAGYHRPYYDNCVPCPTYVVPSPGLPGESTAPETASPEGETQPTAPEETTPQTEAPQAQPYSDTDSSQFAALGSSTMSVNDAAGGYLDNPIVGTWFRLRYDDAINDTTPDRAEFFYAKCSCAPGGTGPINQAMSIAKRVDFRELTPYFELQVAPLWSVFVEAPFRWVDITFAQGVNPADLQQDNNGFSDMNAGFKCALYTDPDQYLTGQFKVYIPTGNSSLGLGTNHTSLEPGLLYLARLSSRASWQGEIRDWIPVGTRDVPNVGPLGNSFAGNVLRYGLGLNYDLIRSYSGSSPVNPYVAPGLRITSVTEVVAWSVLGGSTLDATAPGGPLVSAATTICNIKQGVRITKDSRSLYVGFGQALTGATWYQDIFRLEYRRMF